MTVIVGRIRRRVGTLRGVADSGLSSVDVSGSFDGVRLHVVTGKGGTGKTTVAAALALRIAQQGKRVLLCEVEGRQVLARLFDVADLTYAEQSLIRVERGELLGMSVDPRDALMDYLNTFFVLGGRAGKILDGLGAVDFATTIAPGLRDVLLTGKVYEATKRRTKARRGQVAVPYFDAVVLDAPPTGRITQFLDVSAQVSGLAKVGPIHAQAESMRQVMRAPTTRVHMVTLLEEMPVQEAQESIAQLRAAGFTVGALFANRTRPDSLTPQLCAHLLAGDVPQADVAAELVAAQLVAADRVQSVAAELAASGYATAVKLKQQQRAREQLTQEGLPIVNVPDLAHGVHRDDLGYLATSLASAGVGA